MPFGLAKGLNKMTIEERTPFYAIKLTSEEVIKIKNKKLEFYEIDGKQLFEVKNRNGEKTGEMMFYVKFT